MILIDGIVVSSSNQIVSLTQDEYDALSTEEKNNGLLYLIEDSSDEYYKKLSKIGVLIGDDYDISQYADGTIIGAIIDLYEKMGNISLQLNENQEVEFIYDDEIPEPVRSSISFDELSEEEKINHYAEVMGSEESLNNIGFTNVGDAIVSLYKRLNGVSFAFNQEESELNIIYDKTTV